MVAPMTSSSARTVIDLESWDSKESCGFDSHPRHHDRARNDGHFPHIARLDIGGRPSPSGTSMCDECATCVSSLTRRTPFYAADRIRGGRSGQPSAGLTARARVRRGELGLVAGCHCRCRRNLLRAVQLRRRRSGWHGFFVSEYYATPFAECLQQRFPVALLLFAAVFVWFTRNYRR